MKNLKRECITALVATALLLLLVSGVYPVIVWGISQAFLSQKANGSLIQVQGKIAGSQLIGQDFRSIRYFHPRPSAAGGGYDATSSGGSNLGPTSQRLIDSVKARVTRYREENGVDVNAMVPAEAVMASGSGLDPDISVNNALMQVKRVAQARGMDQAAVRDMVMQSVHKRDLGIFGDPRVNVLKLNLLLDGIN